MNRKNISSGSPYETSIGFSRAVRIGNTVCVSGTAPINKDGATAHPGDVYKQSLRCLEIIKSAIEESGGKLENTIRTRIYLTDIRRWKQASKAHAEVFGKIKPASTLVEVSRLLADDWLVEIEADCVV